MRTSLRSVLGYLVSGVRERAARSDVPLVAAAMTCYALFGLTPLLAIGTRVSSGLFGRADVLRAAQGLARFVPGPLHLDRDIVAFAGSASTAGWWTVLAALLPASLYAEGTVRCLERFSRTTERRSRLLRGRLLTPVFVLMALTGVVLLVGVLRPLLFDPFGTGLGARLLGVLVAFNILFFAVFAVLVVVYRLFATTAVRRGPLVLAAFAAASWISGQTLGYVLAVRAVSGFDNAYGRYAPAATVAAIAFLVYLQHLVFLFGYLLALRLHEQPLRATAPKVQLPGPGAARTTGRPQHGAA